MLLVAVLILFGVATLAALFIGIIGGAHGAGHARLGGERPARDCGGRVGAGKLRAAVRSERRGLAPGSQPIPVGRGQCAMRVSYGPAPNDPQSRYLLVSATATFPDDPFSSYTILGEKPLLLTDYARCITDVNELRQPATLGVSGVEAGGQPRTDYAFTVRGPIFSNTDLIWYGPSTVNLYTSAAALPFSNGTTFGDLGVLRDDRIEVAGAMHSPIFGFDDNGDPIYLSDGNPVAMSVDDIGYASNIFLTTADSSVYHYYDGFPDMTSGLAPGGQYVARAGRRARVREQLLRPSHSAAADGHGGARTSTPTAITR